MMKKELTFYYKIKKPDHITEETMNGEIEHINRIFYRYAFTDITYPVIKSDYGSVFYNRHYDSYVIKVQFLNQHLLQRFKLKHMNLYIDLVSERPSLISKEDFL